LFSKEKTEKKKARIKWPGSDARCYKSRRVDRRSRAIMRTGQAAGTILAAFLCRFELKKDLKKNFEKQLTNETTLKMKRMKFSNNR